MYTEQRDARGNLIGYIKGPVDSYSINSEEVLEWIAAGNTPDPDPNILLKVKQAKIAEYKNEGVRRVALQVAEWDTYEKITLIASLWNMLKVGNAAQNMAKDIVIYVRDTAIPNVNTQVDIASVQAIDVASDASWPA